MQPAAERRTSVWERWSRLLQRRPWPAAVIGGALLLALAAPTLALRLGSADEGSAPTDQTGRRAYDLLAEGFTPGFAGPFLLVTEVPSPQAAAALPAVIEAIRADEGFAVVTDAQLNEAGDAAIITAIPATSPQDEATDELLHRLRDDVLPSATTGTGLDVSVGGVAASNADFAYFIGQRLPIFIGAVLLISFVLLMAMFRSVLVPLKAVILNLLSIGAAYGVMVMVFQWGWFGSLFGVGQGAPIEAWAPMMLFAIVFGLSMDYEVFLLSKIRERYDATGDNSTAVAEGVASTARVISAAAAIMVFVFGFFVFGELREIKLIGLGLATAVFIDATLVRLVLVPATMELLGSRNWWLPKLARPHRPPPRRRRPPSTGGDVALGPRPRAGTHPPLTSRSSAIPARSRARSLPVPGFGRVAVSPRDETPRASSVEWPRRWTQSASGRGGRRSTPSGLARERLPARLVPPPIGRRPRALLRGCCGR